MHITSDRTHVAWDNTLPPVAEVRTGSDITVDLENSSGGQITPRSTVDAIRTLDFGRVNPVTGPLLVPGAEPGDALVIDILDVAVDNWGWTAAIPGFGLLADQFPDPHLSISPIGDGFAELPPGVRVPVVPMIGTIGVALPDPGEHSVVPPRRWGGNMDIRHVGPGARLILPVGVEGALLSLGDTHAAMGDGEVCGTGIETGSTVTLRVDVAKGVAPAFPLIETDPRTHRTGRALAATGIGPDLMRASRDAVSQLIEEVCRRTGIEAVEAYLLASVAADLKISEIVDIPNWVVSAHLELDLIDAARRTRTAN